MSKGKQHPELILFMHMRIPQETLEKMGYSSNQIYAARFRYEHKIKPILKEKGFA